MGSPYRVGMLAPLAWVALMLAACPGSDPGDDDVSPYPDLEVTGTVIDVRGGAVGGAHVTIANAFDSAAADTDASGAFTLVVDGSESPSTVAVAHPGFRPWSGSVTLTDSQPETGTIGIISKEEILFTTYTGDSDIFMIRADGAGGLLQITSTAGVTEVTPRRSTSGHVLRWANTSDGTVYEAAWDGSAARAVHTVDAAHALSGIGWSERGTFVSRRRLADDAEDIIIAEDPPGQTFAYSWTGRYPDPSPPAFGNIGPEPIEGNMLCYAGWVADYEGSGQTRYGLFTAFPYFADQFLRPTHIGATDDGDLYPRWSAFRSDGSLDIALVRGYQILVSHVTSDADNNYYSTPAVVYGGGADDVNVNQIAWAPEIAGSNDRIAVAVNVFSSGSTLAGAGDIVVLEYDHTSGAVVGSPLVVYTAAAAGSPGLALSIDWR